MCKRLSDVAEFSTKDDELHRVETADGLCQIASGSDPLLFSQPPIFMTENRRQPKWFPMRVVYGRDERMLRLKQHLDEVGVENFLPLRHKYTKTEEWDVVKQELVPAVHGLIFVHATQERLTELKMTRREFEPMHYMTNQLMGQGNESILTVPIVQMQNFMRVASVQDDRYVYLDNMDFVAKPGKKVRITDGDFKGVEGVVKRIKKNKCVVVQIEGIAAIALTFVPSAWLEAIDEVI